MITNSDNAWEDYQDKYDWTPEEEAAEKQDKYDEFLRQLAIHEQDISELITNELDPVELVERVMNGVNASREDLPMFDRALGQWLRHQLEDGLKRYIDDTRIDNA